MSVGCGPWWAHKGESPMMGKLMLTPALFTACLAAEPAALPGAALRLHHVVAVVQQDPGALVEVGQHLDDVVGDLQVLDKALAPPRLEELGEVLGDVLLEAQVVDDALDGAVDVVLVALDAKEELPDDDIEGLPDVHECRNV
mgnify:CR=1 FL=1